MTDYNMTGRTYRYLTEKPWKPFGYGLTYGEIVIKDITCCQQTSYKAACETGISYSVSCENTSNLTISDVLQTYVHVNGSDYEVPNSKLAAFKRIQLKPGEKAVFDITVPPSAFHVVNDQGERIADGDGAAIYIGFCSPDFSDTIHTMQKQAVIYVDSPTPYLQG